MLGDFVKKIYTSPISNSETDSNVFLTRMLIINNKGELTSHWTPITELGKFLERVYFGSGERCSYSKTVACPYCCETFFPSKSSVTINEVKQEICRMKKEKTEKFSHFLCHLEECRCDRLTTIYYPQDENLTFSKFKALIEPAVRYVS